MKCQICGSENASFHQIVIVNGFTKEIHMCSQCAVKAGIDYSDIFNMGKVLGGTSGKGMQNFFTGIAGLSNAAFANMPKNTTNSDDININDDDRLSEQDIPAVDVDPEMQKRREINTIRERMFNAAQKEDYEEAAALRDKIKQMENESIK
ncbi:MAG: UvrB/UvrC motif-containing protein [Oscillospiraceae bacterium]|nr:UvrB/UvrC motif-containing protein [Oscillospiraceae bacterium]